MENKSDKIDIVHFLYKADCDYYKDDLGVKQSEFVNIEKSELNSTEQVVNLAKKEYTVKYDTVSVAFDSDSNIYRVSFYIEEQVGGNQYIY